MQYGFRKKSYLLIGNSSAYEDITYKVLTKETLMNDAVKKQEEHRRIKPELKEGDGEHQSPDTIETLETRIKEQEPKMIEIAEKKGAINQLLKTDEENKKNLGKLIEEVNKRYDEYQKWSRMNQLIGDATGNKFRKIAQSYVLTSLIHSANSYMKTLTDRYTLKVAPGTFVISLEDAYQGYVSRATGLYPGVCPVCSLCCEQAALEIPYS